MVVHAFLNIRTCATHLNKPQTFDLRLLSSWTVLEIKQMEAQDTETLGKVTLYNYSI